MDGQCADISDITGDHCVFQAVENPESPFSASCPEGENAAAEALELCAAKVSVRAALKQRIVDLDSIDAAQSFRQPAGVAADSLHTQPQSFESGDVQKGICRRQAASHIFRDNCAQADGISQISKFPVAVKCPETVEIPFEFCGIYDDTANGISVSVDVFGG